MRSGTTVWVTARRRSTPSTVMVEPPAPSTSAPMRFRKAARSAISGSRAALSITVVPLASAAAIKRFSVAPTLGYSRMTRAPSRRSARPSMYPWLAVKVAPSSFRARRCMSIGRWPKSSPPGTDTRASPNRARSGPSTTMEARMRSTSS